MRFAKIAENCEDWRVNKSFVQFDAYHSKIILSIFKRCEIFAGKLISFLSREWGNEKNYMKHDISAVLQSSQQEKGLYE